MAPESSTPEQPIEIYHSRASVYIPNPPLPGEALTAWGKWKHAMTLALVWSTVASVLLTGAMVAWFNPR